MAMFSDVSVPFPGPEDWDASSCNAHVTRPFGTDYLDLATATFDRLCHALPEPSHLASPALYTSQASFTVSSAPISIPPLQTRLDSTSLSNASGSTDNNLPSSASLSFDSWNQNADEDSFSRKRRRRSAGTPVDGASPTVPKRMTGRRRKSENVEPGSARAVYLEKNRKAANKCRTKQKMQQEELVETARESERMNKALKAEVEFLTADTRGLMDMVGKHTGCPDTRLQTYVQHEADRLMARDKDSLVARLLSSTDSASPEGA